MEINNLRPAEGSAKNKRRVGRGIGSRGKTCGRGHKGQKSRGCLGMVGFEGGQMPLQRRVPKFGFISKKSLAAESVPTSMLAKIAQEDQAQVDLAVLKKYGIVKQSTKYVKIFLSGELNIKMKLHGLAVSKGAKAMLEKLGGEVV
ncbi:MAG: 50S ribosomal protein L15 [Pseudomonadota bacterium]|nr:50S ribosomal protein L15 [Pseudomonadota bacterium]